MGDEEQKATGSNKYLNPYKSRRQIFIDNFIGGFAWAFGTLIGLSLLGVIIGYFIARIDFIPLIGSWLADVFKDASTKFPTR